VIVGFETYAGYSTLSSKFRSMQIKGKFVLIWDAQKDIFLAFSGAILATTIVSVIKRTFNIYEKES
jgi:hypothetical protein